MENILEQILEAGPRPSTVSASRSHTRTGNCSCSRCRERREEEFFYDWLRNWLPQPTPTPAPAPASPGTTTTYRVVPGKEYGWKWKSRRPPGLPAWARQASTRGAALPDVARTARSKGLGSTFTKAIVQMAKTESGGTYGLPAHTFNADPPHLRPRGKGLITAWGVFQFNRDAWTPLIAGSRRSARRSFRPKGDGGCGAQHGCVFPWDCTVREEIELPINRYVALFREVKRAGGSDTDAARGLRMWHISPIAWYRKWLNRAKRSGFAAAWRELTAAQRARIDPFTRAAGIP